MMRLVSVDAIYGVGIRHRGLMLSPSFPERPENSFGVMEVVMHDIHQVRSFHEFRD